MSPLSSAALRGVRPVTINRARSHVRPTRLASLAVAAALCLGLPACDGDAKSTSAASPSLASGTNDERIQQLVVAFTPLQLDLTSDHHDRHLHAQRALLEELKQGDQGLGREALHVYEQGGQEVEAVRYSLLTVASHCTPEEMQPKLEKLILQYGEGPIADRAAAVALLAETSPERAIEIFEPLLKKKKQHTTMPDDEFFVRGYITACRESGHDPAPALADVATNIFKQPAARYFAAQELGNHPGKVSWNALRQILIESTGDQYLKIKAAQAVLASAPRETACALFEEILQREASDGKNGR